MKLRWLGLALIYCAVTGAAHAKQEQKPEFRFAAILLATTACRAAEDLPNIVTIYADDLGYGDLSCDNPKAAYKTPRLDRMAKEGIRFTDAHSPSTICSPSRYGLCSGQQIYRSTGWGASAAGNRNRSPRSCSVRLSIRPGTASKAAGPI